MRELRRILHAAMLRVARRHLCRIVPVTMCGITLSACSLTIPMAGLGTEDGPTGSIKPAERSSLSAEMDAEDWRRAKSALDTALDPQGNGASVAWDNPVSGTKGSFVPVTQAFPKDDGICRAFSAKLDLKGQAGRLFHSSACRKNGGEWTVGPIKTLNRIAGVPHTKNDNLAERDTDTQLH